MNKNSNTDPITSGSSNAYKWENCKGWLNPYQPSGYYNMLDWCGEGSFSNSCTSGNNVILTHTTTVANNHVTRFQGDAYFGIYVYPNVVNCPYAAAYKYFRVELQSIEFLTYIKY